MSFWSGKNKSGVEKSADESTIHRYASVERPKIGFTPAAGHSEAREEVYGRLLGEASSVSHEVLPLVPHIDVYTYDTTSNKRGFCTLVTGGMSDLEMSLPKGATGVP